MMIEMPGFQQLNPQRKAALTETF
jgi:hypothetical protein